MNIPENLLYTKTHEWVLIAGGKARVGLTDYAQDALGDIVYFNLPQVGDDVTAGGVAGEVESVKAVSEVRSPLSGAVCAVNDSLADAPETANAAPYDAWIFEIENFGGDGGASGAGGGGASKAGGAGGGSANEVGGAGGEDGSASGAGGAYGLLSPAEYADFCAAGGHI